MKKFGIGLIGVGVLFVLLAFGLKSAYDDDQFQPQINGHAKVIHVVGATRVLQYDSTDVRLNWHIDARVGDTVAVDNATNPRFIEWLFITVMSGYMIGILCILIGGTTVFTSR